MSKKIGGKMKGTAGKPSTSPQALGRNTRRSAPGPGAVAASAPTPTASGETPDTTVAEPSRLEMATSRNFVPWTRDAGVSFAFTTYQASKIFQSDVADGWRDHRRDGGCIVDLETDRILAKGLSMPHSPRLHEGKLWVLDSGNGYLCRVDRPALLS